jgi:hypothetical protein
MTTTVGSNGLRWHAVRDLLGFTLGVVLAVTGYVTGISAVLILGVALVVMPLITHAKPDPRIGPRGERDCVCRGCRRPGRRYLWERVIGRPIATVPRTHAQGQLGVTHGRIHDARRLEAEAGIPHSGEVIAHFDLPPERYIETPEEADEWSSWERGGCHAVPELISTIWR